MGRGRAGCGVRLGRAAASERARDEADGPHPRLRLVTCPPTFCMLRRTRATAGVGRYATFAALAGEDPTDHAAASAGLPPVDGETTIIFIVTLRGETRGSDADIAPNPLPGLDVWPLISGANSTSPRVVLPLSAQAIIVGDWKLLLGKVGESGWTGWTCKRSTRHRPKTFFKKSQWT